MSRAEEIVITGHCKVVARTLPDGSASRESVRLAVSGLQALRKRMAAREGFQPLTDSEIKASIFVVDASVAIARAVDSQASPQTE